MVEQGPIVWSVDSSCERSGYSGLRVVAFQFRFDRFAGDGSCCCGRCTGDCGMDRLHNGDDAATSPIRT